MDRNCLWTASLALFLVTACSEPAEDYGQSAADEVPEQTQSDELDRLIDLSQTDRDDLRAALRDPQRRGALMEALREQRGTEGLGPEARERREQIRERMRERIAEREPGELRGGLRGNWWEDEAISSRLELDPEQIERIDQAHQALGQTRRQSRQTMAQGQRQMLQAVQDSDREQIETLLAERHAAAVAQVEAEQQWLQTLLNELSDEQLLVLAEDYPRALMRRQ